MDLPAFDMFGALVRRSFKWDAEPLFGPAVLHPKNDTLPVARSCIAATTVISFMSAISLST